MHIPSRAAVRHPARWQSLELDFRRRVRRRGVLLLVVLSMLTLFMMLGAAYVVATSRARETARAYARLTLGGDSARIPTAQLLDSVLLTTLRGPWTSGTTLGRGLTVGTTGTIGIVTGGTVSFESILADKYGPMTATVSVSGVRPAVDGNASILNSTVSFDNFVRPTDLNGRVLSFVGPGRAVSSHRIIRASNTQAGDNSSGTTFLVYLDAPASQRPFTLPSAGRAIVNGREFAGRPSNNPTLASGAIPPWTAPSNEPWDAFDAHNPFLAQVATGPTISTSTVSRLSYLPALPTAALTATWDYDGDSIPDAADNDNDGALDGVFLDFGIPDVVDANGNAVQLRASVLVVDLDGRFNVNAHDSLARILYTGTNYNWASGTNNCWPVNPGWTTVAGSGTLPMGSGYGPAEVNGGWMTFTNSSLVSTGTFATTENPLLLSLAGGASGLVNGRRPTGSRFSSGTATPRLGSLEGRYGERGAANWNSVPITMFLTSGSFARPGAPTIDDELSRTNDRRASSSGAASVNYGVPPVWWTGTSGFDWSGPPAVSGATVSSPRGVFNSPPDLHGRMRTVTGPAASGGVVPQLLFAKPEWASTASQGARETTDDPYEILLDTRLGRGGQLHDPSTDGLTTSGTVADNPFQPAELEAVLRPYDSDSSRLAPRLAAILGSAAEEARLRVTTESWDTTAITGSAALVLFGTAGGTTGWLQSATTGNVYGNTMVLGIIGGEASRGERLDLNRGLLASGVATATYDASNLYYLQRQALFKDVYTLLVALGASASGATAQWVANALEFRDADSVMTPFEYDTNPANGWDVDGNVTTIDGGSNERAVVFGAERPEVLIQQAFAWRNTATGTGGMAITLHRPWNATAFSGTIAGVAAGTTPGEPCDYALDRLSAGSSGTPQNIVDLGKKPHAGIMAQATNALYNAGTDTYPIWRLKIVAGGSTSFVRCDTGTAAIDEFAVAGLTDANKLTLGPTLGADGTITLLSGTTIPLSGTNAVGTVTTVTGTLRLPAGLTNSSTIAGLRVPGTATTATISLERLSDPSQRLSVGGTIGGSSGPTPVAAVWTQQVPIASGTVPVQYIVVDSCTISVCETGTGNAVLNPTLPVAGFISCRTGSNGPFWLPAQTIPASCSLDQPLQLLSSASGSTAWLPWPNRPFISATELLLVPRTDQLGLLHSYQRPTTANQSTVGIPVAPDLLFDAVHVPTRFAGIHRTDATDAPATAGIFTTANQLSSFREPGRVNLNTVTGSDVWNAVVAGSGTAPLQALGPWTSLAASGTPARTMAHLLALSGTGTGYGVIVTSDTAAPGTALATGTTWNPLHTIYTATRLANTTTPRSNVFAIWVTLRESVAGNPDSVRLRRAFYIVDRSIPVGYEEGRDHNVRDCIRLRRIIE